MYHSHLVASMNMTMYHFHYHTVYHHTVYHTMYNPLLLSSSIICHCVTCLHSMSSQYYHMFIYHLSVSKFLRTEKTVECLSSRVDIYYINITTLIVKLDECILFLLCFNISLLSYISPIQYIDNYTAL